MIPNLNRRVILIQRPVGIPQASHFEIVSSPIPELQSGQLLVRNEFLSVEPAMRGWLNATANYAEPVAIGDTMRSFAAGTVIASRHPLYAEGDRVMGMLGWQEYAVTDGKTIRRKVLEADLPLSYSLGILGINGVTAYFALTEIGQPRPGDTLVVSTAAGAVGSAVGQLARIAGCCTVGITGGAIKQQLCLEKFGFDAAVDYKSANFETDFAAATPKGVDIYHDNTAGRISDVVVRRINKRARIICCGTASVANWDDWPSGPRIERHLLNKAARMEGFLIWDYEHRYEEAVARLSDWLRSGKLVHSEEILEGIEHAPGAIATLYRGENHGKLIVRLHHSAK
jgi:NADPH-dependent curcumin reductase CurA